MSDGAGLLDACVLWCAECSDQTEHYRPDDWQWRAAAGDGAFVCLACEDAQVTP